MELFSGRSQGGISCRVLASGDLEITADAEARERIADLLPGGYWSTWADLFEPYSTNGSYEPFNAGDGNPCVGLTSAPCIAESMTVENDGTRAIEGRCWWFPNYAVTDPLDTLRDAVRVVFTLAREAGEGPAASRDTQKPEPEADKPEPAKWGIGTPSKTKAGNIVVPITEGGVDIGGMWAAEGNVLLAVYRAACASSFPEALALLRTVADYHSSEDDGPYSSAFVGRVRAFVERFPK